MKNWKTVDESIVFDAPPYLKVLKQTVEIPDGSHIDDFYQVHLRNFVVVVPLLQNGKILTIRQYKHGPGRVSLTFPAGFIDDGENPAEACVRELVEETGYEASSLVQLGEFVDNGNQRGCIGHYFFAADCVKVKEPNSGDLEEMSIEERSVCEVDQALKSGDISIIHHASVWSMARLQGLISQQK